MTKTNTPCNHLFIRTIGLGLLASSLAACGGPEGDLERTEDLPFLNYDFQTQGVSDSTPLSFDGWTNPTGWRSCVKILGKKFCVHKIMDISPGEIEVTGTIDNARIEARATTGANIFRRIGDIRDMTNWKCGNHNAGTSIRTCIRVTQTWNTATTFEYQLQIRADFKAGFAGQSAKDKKVVYDRRITN